MRVPVEVVVDLAEQLEQGLFLDGPSFQAARRKVERDFIDNPVRPASHAGGAYHAERRALARYIEETCIARAASANGHASAGGGSANGAASSGEGTHGRAANGTASGNGSANGAGSNGHGGHMIALVAPHIDPWRGAVGYGHAYHALAEALPPDADTFVLFGTSHAPMREPFALCRKAFATPFGAASADTDAIDSIAQCAEGFDPYADQFNHKREHSLEFQVVFLKHLLKNRPFRIVPILAGLGANQASTQDPSRDKRVNRFMSGVRDLFESRPGRVVVVAGADMAHVGPRFGDASPFDAERRAGLESADRASLGHAASLDARGFWSHVVTDLDERRVCGLAPIWSLVHAVKGSGATGKVLHYEQTVDAEDGSIVSHAALGFYA
jgi:AmmeMemoRadiSam system protein B